ncbi:peroxiredoxin family protein [Pedobacter africanus]|uniref:Peroxiredoxin n=1 Tax=Pedobacter africanus TaxID=151894 RepID=A0A1W2E8H0_9SPHI|nr:TlpA disulfide reductase family protein [Pedobacter africanus]SMD05358.1 Peroxiredoxin [Pedobacter africanus]
MKKFKLPLLGLTMMALSAAAQEKLEITAKMPELVNGERVLLWNVFSNAQDSTIVKDNSFSLTVNVENGGSTYILQAGIDPEKNGLGMFMLMQPGKMHIEGGNGTGFKGATFTGDAFVTDWVEMEKSMQPTHDLMNQMQDMIADLNEATKLGDKEAAKKLAEEVQVLGKKVAANGKQYMDSHLGSAASAYIMNALMPDVMTSMEKISYLSKFTGRAYNNHLAKSMLNNLTGTETQWIGKPAPDFSQPDVTGKVVNLKDFKGKYVLVDFWASWCGPCRADAPELKEVHEKMKDKNISFVSISLDSDKSKWQQALAEENMTWQQLSDLKGDQNAASLAYKVKGIPAKFLIDPNGIIIGAGFREVKIGPKEKILEKSLNELMK